MKDLFNRALRMSQSSGEGKLNFRHAERHVPGMFNGKATEYTEYFFKMEAYTSTLDPAGKGGEILRAAATEVKDMDDAEVANLATIYWNVSALNSALASSLITTTTGEVGTAHSAVKKKEQCDPCDSCRRENHAREREEDAATPKRKKEKTAPPRGESSTTPKTDGTAQTTSPKGGEGDSTTPKGGLATT